MPAKTKSAKNVREKGEKKNENKKAVKKVETAAQSTLKKGAAIIKNIAPKKIFAKSKTITKGIISKIPLPKSKKVLAVITILILIVAAGVIIGLSPSGGGPSGPSGTPTNQTPVQPHAPYHMEYDTPAMTSGGVLFYKYVENKFPVDANATKLTAKLTITSKIGPILEVNYIIKDSKGKELKKVTITSDSGGTIDISNTTLNSSGPGQYTSRVEVWKGVQVVAHVVIDVSYPTANATQPK